MKDLYDFTNPPYFSYEDNRSKLQKIKSDITMIIEPNNMRPINEWFDIWKQLLKHLFCMVD